MLMIMTGHGRPIVCMPILTSRNGIPELTSRPKLGPHTHMRATQLGSTAGIQRSDLHVLAKVHKVIDLRPRMLVSAQRKILSGALQRCPATLLTTVHTVQQP